MGGGDPPGQYPAGLASAYCGPCEAMRLRAMDDIADLLELDAAGEPLSGRIVQIFQVACRLFAQRGFDGVSMRDIALECGLSKATLYHYFPDKDSILRPLAIGTTKSLCLHVLRHDRPEAPPLERLRSFLTETAKFFEKFRWAWIAASTVFWSDPKIRTRKERIAWRDRYEQLLRDILQAGMDASGDLDGQRTRSRHRVEQSRTIEETTAARAGNWATKGSSTSCSRHRCCPRPSSTKRDPRCHQPW